MNNKQAISYYKRLGAIKARLKSNQGTVKALNKAIERDKRVVNRFAYRDVIINHKGVLIDIHVDRKASYGPHCRIKAISDEINRWVSIYPSAHDKGKHYGAHLKLYDVQSAWTEMWLGVHWTDSQELVDIALDFVAKAKLPQRIGNRDPRFVANVKKSGKE